MILSFLRRGECTFSLYGYLIAIPSGETEGAMGINEGNTLEILSEPCIFNLTLTQFRLTQSNKQIKNVIYKQSPNTCCLEWVQL